VPIEETLSAFTDLVRAGKVRYLGCSNFSAWRLMQALWTSDARNLESFVSIQPEYNLLGPVRGDFETELAQVCLEYGIGVIPYSPLAGGVLTGKYRRDSGLPDSVRAQENAERRLGDTLADTNWRIVETLVDVAAQAGLTPAQAAIQWLRSKPWVCAPIVGANQPEQLRDVLAGLDTPIPAEAVARLDDVSHCHRPRAHREN
jgi:aryl-alcohol dehydrogenase-like predicted oxidoreductase